MYPHPLPDSSISYASVDASRQKETTSLTEWLSKCSSSTDMVYHTSFHCIMQSCAVQQETAALPHFSCGFSAFIREMQESRLSGSFPLACSNQHLHRVTASPFRSKPLSRSERCFPRPCGHEQVRGGDHRSKSSTDTSYIMRIPPSLRACQRIAESSERRGCT